MAIFCAKAIKSAVQSVILARISVLWFSQTVGVEATGSPDEYQIQVEARA